jgi:signal peptidase I
MGKIQISKGKYGFNLHIELFKHNFVIRTFKTFDTETTVGIRNSTDDGKRLMFLDYDNILYKENLLPELHYLQEKYGLSDFYIFKSSQKIGNYHVICLDKLTAREWCNLIEETNVDNNYKRVPIFVDNKAWVLRFIPKKNSLKPELIEIMKSKHHERTKSRPHAKFLELNYDIKIESLINLDNEKEVTITTYQTLNYIK